MPFELVPTFAVTDLYLRLDAAPPQNCPERQRSRKAGARNPGGTPHHRERAPGSSNGERRLGSRLPRVSGPPAQCGPRPPHAGQTEPGDQKRHQPQALQNQSLALPAERGKASQTRDGLLRLNIRILARSGAASALASRLQ
jgi:hypothetical protein